VTQVEVLKFAKVHYPDALPATIDRQVFAPLISIWRAAKEAGLCGPHAFRRPRKGDREPVAFARDDYLAELLPACGERLKAALLFVSFTGARASEACRLKSEHVDWEAGTAFLPRTKNGQPRTVVLAPMLLAAMQPLKGAEGPLFGMKTRWVLNQALARACRRAQLPVMTSHKVGRHAFAARLLKEGRTLKEVQEAGGWSAESIAMIARVYGHLERSAVDKIVRDSDGGLTQILRKRARSRLQVVTGARKK
jgi:integrase